MEARWGILPPSCRCKYYYRLISRSGNAIASSDDRLITAQEISLLFLKEKLSSSFLCRSLSGSFVPDLIVSMTHQMWLHLQSDESVGSIGFKINYKGKHACSQEDEHPKRPQINPLRNLDKYVSTCARVDVLPCRQPYKYNASLFIWYPDKCASSSTQPLQFPSP